VGILLIAIAAVSIGVGGDSFGLTLGWVGIPSIVIPIGEDSDGDGIPQIYTGLVLSHLPIFTDVKHISYS